MASPELLETPFMVTELEAALSNLPEAVAFALMVVPELKDKPVIVHVPSEVVVVDPSKVDPL